jgi:hypothetical protein
LVPFPRRPGFEPWLTKKQLAAHYGYSTRWVELRMRDGLPSHPRAIEIFLPLRALRAARGFAPALVETPTGA